MAKNIGKMKNNQQKISDLSILVRTILCNFKGGLHVTFV